MKISKLSKSHCNRIRFLSSSNETPGKEILVGSYMRSFIELARLESIPNDWHAYTPTLQKMVESVMISKPRKSH